MGRWYKTEYELPVVFLFTLVGALVPWQYSIGSTAYGSFNVIRWWFGEFRITNIEGFSGFVPVHAAVLQQQTTSVFPAFVLWAAGAVGVVLTLLLAASFLIDDERVAETLPIGTLAAGLFAGIGVLFLGSTILFATNGISSTPIPLGTIFYLAFAVIIYNN